MQIVIIGTGAVGGFYGGKLSLAGEEVICLARGSTFDYLKENKLRVKSYQGDFSTFIKVVDSLKDIPSPDLVIITVKTYDTDAALDLIGPLVSSQTTLMSLQNGVESEEKMIARFGSERVIGSVCYIGAEVTKPGMIEHCADGTVTIGEMDGFESERIESIYNTFKKARIEIKKSDEIKKVLWTKLLWNTAFNQVCALEEKSVGEILDQHENWDRLKEIMQEVCTIAARHQVALDKALIDKLLAFSNKSLRLVCPSMLQDRRRGKPMEYETFGGFIIRSGKTFGIPTPCNEGLHEELCKLEKK
jgi:2-dehydropantoate 2-reductase